MMNIATAVPTDAIRIVRVSTDDFATPHATLADRNFLATIRPDLADDMRVGTLTVHIDAFAPDFDPDTTPDTRHAYIEWCEHIDPLNPDATVTRFAETAIQTIERELVQMRDRGAVPDYIARVALADLR